MIASEPFNRDAFLTSLDRLRREAGMSWREVAEDAGVSQSTLEHVVGRQVYPRIDTFAKLIAWSGLDANEFIVRHEESETTP